MFLTLRHFSYLCYSLKLPLFLVAIICLRFEGSPFPFLPGRNVSCIYFRVHTAGMSCIVISREKQDIHEHFKGRNRPTTKKQTINCIQLIFLSGTGEKTMTKLVVSAFLL
jgi:hypothetical protein